MVAGVGRSTFVVGGVGSGRAANSGALRTAYIEPQGFARYGQQPPVPRGSWTGAEGMGRVLDLFAGLSPGFGAAGLDIATAMQKDPAEAKSHHGGAACKAGVGDFRQRSTARLSVPSARGCGRCGNHVPRRTRGGPVRGGHGVSGGADLGRWRAAGGGRGAGAEAPVSVRLGWFGGV